MKHVRKECDKKNREDHSERHCNICDGGLFICAVCGGAEGTLTTDCPGNKLDEETQTRIYVGHIDFKDGVWITKKECSEIVVNVKLRYTDL